MEGSRGVKGGQEEVAGLANLAKVLEPCLLRKSKNHVRRNYRDDVLDAKMGQLYGDTQGEICKAQACVMIRHCLGAEIVPEQGWSTRGPYPATQRL